MENPRNETNGVKGREAEGFEVRVRKTNVANSIAATKQSSHFRTLEQTETAQVLERNNPKVP